MGVRKPNSKIFDYALNLANSKKEESILIGDDWIADFQGGRNYGLDVIFFDVFKEKQDLKDIKRIESLLEITKLL